MSQIRDNIQLIKDNIPKTTLLVAVSKTKPVSDIMEAYDCGHRDFGENKVQEMVGKYEELPKDIHWHMIGHLQRNKVKYIAPFVHLIHSIDSEKLLAEVNKEGAKNNRVINCLLQVHIAEEETKFGFDEAELSEFISSRRLSDYPNVNVIGLMGMATFTENTSQIEREFRGLKALFDKINSQGILKLSELSIGMSGDYQIAVKCGSTLIRVGSSIFGERNYTN